MELKDYLVHYSQKITKIGIGFLLLSIIVLLIFITGNLLAPELNLSYHKSIFDLAAGFCVGVSVSCMMISTSLDVMVKKNASQ